MTEGRSGRSIGVILGGGALVLATGVALTLAPESTADASDAGSELPTWPASELDGARGDLFALPDEPLAGFVLIPEGPFLMGSDPSVDPMAFAVERWSSTERQGRLELPAFYLARYEVTVAQFVDFARATGHRVPEPSELGARPDHPVVNVSWADALRYTQWLDSALRRSSATPPDVKVLLDEGWRVTLPDEAQWEKAARGTDGALFPWGDGFERSYANVGTGAVAAVGSRSCPCAHGLSDMAGNVWEWTLSPYQPYPHSTSDDARTVRDDALWVMRGGSFQDDPQQARAANRGGADPGARRPFIGFRIALVSER